MAKGRGEFTDILLRKNLLSQDQLIEARALSQQTGAKLQDAIMKLGYASIDEIVGAVAEHAGMQSVNLAELTIPPAIVDFAPRAVARETVVVPLAQDSGTLRIVVPDPAEFDPLQKLQVILSKEVQAVLAAGEQIVEAINRHYGQTQTQSVDSMLQEFTDTQIDF